jgi:hypothetical protein
VFGAGMVLFLHIKKHASLVWWCCSLSQVMSWCCMVSMERNLVDHLVSVYVHVDLVQANSDVQEILGAANSTRPGPCSV